MAAGVPMSSGPGAAGLPSDGAGMVHQVAGIAGAPGSLAEAVLAQVQVQVQPGFDERVCGFLDGPGYLADVEQIGLRRSRRPLRVRDLPFPLSELPLWGEYLGP